MKRTVRARGILLLGAVLLPSCMLGEQGAARRVADADPAEGAGTTGTEVAAQSFDAVPAAVLAAVPADNRDVFELVDRLETARAEAAGLELKVAEGRQLARQGRIQAAEVEPSVARLAGLKARIERMEALCERERFAAEAAADALRRIRTRTERWTLTDEQTLAVKSLELRILGRMELLDGAR